MRVQVCMHASVCVRVCVCVCSVCLSVSRMFYADSGQLRQYEFIYNPNLINSDTSLLCGGGGGLDS